MPDHRTILLSLGHQSSEKHLNAGVVREQWFVMDTLLLCTISSPVKNDGSDNVPDIDQVAGEKQKLSNQRNTMELFFLAKENQSHVDDINVVISQ